MALRAQAGALVPAEAPVQVVRVVLVAAAAGSRTPKGRSNRGGPSLRAAGLAARISQADSQLAVPRGASGVMGAADRPSRTSERASARSARECPERKGRDRGSEGTKVTCQR